MRARRMDSTSASRTPGSRFSSASAITWAGTRSESGRTRSNFSVSARSAAAPPSRTSARIGRTVSMATPTSTSARGSTPRKSSGERAEPRRSIVRITVAILLARAYRSRPLFTFWIRGQGFRSGPSHGFGEAHRVLVAPGTLDGSAQRHCEQERRVGFAFHLEWPIGNDEVAPFPAEPLGAPRAQPEPTRDDQQGRFPGGGLHVHHRTLTQRDRSLPQPLLVPTHDGVGRPAAGCLLGNLE